MMKETDSYAAMEQDICGLGEGAEGGGEIEVSLDARCLWKSRLFAAREDYNGRQQIKTDFDVSSDIFMIVPYTAILKN